MNSYWVDKQWELMEEIESPEWVYGKELQFIEDELNNE